MSMDFFSNRNTNGYIYLDTNKAPKTKWNGFRKFLKTTFSLDLLVGLKIVLWEMLKGKKNNQTVQYPLERFEIGPRYRALHELQRLLESGNERCIGCGLCEKICVAKCIRIDSKIDRDGRKLASEYTINFGRCIFCGLCAEVCPELAIVHGIEYENASEQRALFSFKDDMLTPIDKVKNKKEFEGYGSVSKNADKLIKKTPLTY